MPTYQYQCTECGNSLEVRQSFTDDALTVCPSCDGVLRKVFNAVGVVFKGSGFYRTDSREKAPSSVSAKSDGSGGSASGGKSESAAPAAAAAANGSSAGGSSSGGSTSGGSSTGGSSSGSGSASGGSSGSGSTKSSAA